MTRALATVVFASSLAAAPALADTFVIDRVHSEASFQVRHLVTKVRGRFTDFSGTVVGDPAKPTAATVEFTVKAASIDTDQERRDTHLRSADFFDAEKYPDINFKSTRIVQTGKDRYDVTGNLSMRGVTREVTLAVTYLGAMGDKIGFEATTTLNRKDFGIVWNKALDTGGFVLGDDVIVTINIEAARKKEIASQ
jgi:polyisoprenoid-binding protein YceI